MTAINTSLNFTGLVSGLDTDSIITQLVRFNQRRIDTLRVRELEAELDLTLFTEIENRVRNLDTVNTQLAASVNSVFDAKTVTTSDDTIVTAAAGTGAVTSTQTFFVNSIARANQVASQGFASQNTTITQDAFDISAGGATATITIDATNNTLQGLAQAINAAGAGVRAAIIDDGSATDPFRLLLTSENTGTSSAITVTGNATGVNFDFANPVQAATNSQVQLGSGAGAIVVNNQTNIVQGLIPGVTLNLLSADATKEITLTIADDATGGRTAILDFVEDFNDLMQFIDEQSALDPVTDEFGPLNGNTSAISIQDSIRQTVLSISANLPSSINRLSVLGITVNSQGRLDVNTTTLDSILSGQSEDVTFSDLRRLFGFTGESTNAGVQFLLGSSDTREGTVQVDLTQAAERATITATNTLAANATIDATNNQLTITVDGQVSATITLTQGSFTRQQLADELETRINGDTTLGSRNVAVTLSSDQLVITSDVFGFASEVAIGTGTAVTALGFAGTESDRGQDVVGKFIVDGVTENAVGSGQVLVGDSGNTNTSGLRVLVTLGNAQINPGTVEAEITVARGVSSRLDLLLDQFLDPFTGRLNSINDAIEAEIDDAQEAIADETEALEERQAALLRQFAQLERIIGQTQSQSNLITAQLTPLLNRRR